MHSVTCTHHFVYFCVKKSQQDATFWGVGTWGWDYDPKFELGREFYTMHLPTKFHHPMFNGLNVIMLTNKQTLLKTSTSLHCAMLFVKNVLSDNVCDTL